MWKNACVLWSLFLHGDYWSHSFALAFAPSLEALNTRLHHRRRNRIRKDDGHLHMAGSFISTNFKRQGNRINFGATLQIQEVLKGVDPKGLELYLKDPRNMMAAAWPRDLIEPLGNDEYRLNQEPLNFANLLQIEYSVDVRTVERASGGIEMESTRIRSTASLGGGVRQEVPIDLTLTGVLQPLKPVSQGQGVLLQGDVKFATSGQLIGPLLFAPTPVLQAATDTVNRGILEYARREFVRGVRKGYMDWWTPARQREVGTGY